MYDDGNLPDSDNEPSITGWIGVTVFVAATNEPGPVGRHPILRAFAVAGAVFFRRRVRRRRGPAAAPDGAGQ